MITAAVLAAAGWLGLLLLALSVPPPVPWRRTADAPAGGEPPAVIGLLARKPDMVLFQATLLDLAARGWYRLGPVDALGAGEGGANAEGALVMCEVAAERPPEPLAPFESRALAHVAKRAGARGTVPAHGLCDGFSDDEQRFLAQFHDEAFADARRRGLSTTRFGGARTGSLCAAALAAAVLGVIATHSPPWGFGIFMAFLSACGWVSMIGRRETRTPAGRNALDRYRASTRGNGPWEPGAADRGAAYAAALGEGAVAAATFGQRDAKVMWSGYGGRWRPVTIGHAEERKRPGTWTGAYLVGGFPVLSILTALSLGLSGMAGLVARALLVCLVAGAVLMLRYEVTHRSRLPVAAEFDAQVMKRWIEEGSEDTPTTYHAAFDDGVRDEAWAFNVGLRTYQSLVPAQFVRIRVNPRRNKLLSVGATEPPATAPVFAGITAAVRANDEPGGLPDPALLVTADDAAEILGSPARARDSGINVVGRSVTWQTVRGGRPSVQAIVYGGALAAAIANKSARRWRPVPGTVGGMYRHGLGVVSAGELTAQVKVSGMARGAAAAATARLLPRVEQRLAAEDRLRAAAG